MTFYRHMLSVEAFSCTFLLGKSKVNFSSYRVKSQDKLPEDTLHVEQVQTVFLISTW